MAYRAEIEIGVKGAKYLDELQNKLTQVSKSIDQLNRQEVVVRRTIAGAASNVPMGPGGTGVTSASAEAAAMAVENKVRAMRRESTQAEIKAVRNRGFAENYITTIIQNRLQEKAKELSIEEKITAENNKRASAAFRSRAGSAISSAVIGGGFPLLFGQGPGAAAGGGIGGLAGGLIGGGFGFALSIAGTAIGEAADKADKFNQSLAVLNSRVSATGSTSKITANDIKTLANNLGIAEEEAIKVLDAFAGFKDATTTKALAAVFGTDSATMQSLAAAKDKAGLAQVILNNYEKITAQTALQLINQLKTTDSATVEIAFQKALLDYETKKTEEKLKQVTLQDRILAGLATAGIFMGGGNQVIAPEVFGQQRAATFRKQQAPNILQDALKAVNLLRQANQAAESLRSDTKGENAAKRAAEAAAKEAERVEKLVRDRRASAEYIRIESGLKDKIAAAENAQDPILAARLKGEQAILNIQYDYAKLLADEKNPRAQAFLIYEGLTRITAANRDTEREINAIYVQRQRIMTDLSNDLDYELKLKYATTQDEKTRIEIEKERAKLIKDGITDENFLADIAAKRLALAQPVLGSALIKQQVGGLSDEITKLMDVGTQIIQIAENIGNAFANSFKGVISGAMTAQEALASFFQSVADRFLDMAAQIIAKWIEMTILNSVLSLFPGSPRGGGLAGLFGAGAPAAVAGGGIFTGAGPYQFRAAGGPVTGNTPYMVGERGPELFVPGRSGTIIPNNQLGNGGTTSVVVNVDASGSSVQGNGQGANQLGRVIGIAVQQEIIKQKRPGGLLS